MSLPVTAIFPSCTSLGCTNSMEPNMPSSFRRMAQTKPSKSLRVRSLYFVDSVLMFRLSRPSADSVRNCSGDHHLLLRLAVPGPRRYIFVGPVQNHIGDFQV